MSRIIQPIAFTLGWIMLTVLVVTSWKGSVMGMYFEPVVFGVIFATLVRGGLMSVGMGAVSGWIYDTASPWPVGVHVVAIMAAILVVRIVLRYWLTERSAASFMFLILIGSLTYTASLGSAIFISHAFAPNSLVPDWQTFFQVGVLQAAAHTIMSLAILRIRRSRYARAHVSHQF